MGDLNYRATRAAEPTERALLEASESAGLDEDGAPLENNRYFEVLKQTDELYHVLQTHKSFYGFEEAPVNFPPTFKYIEGSIGTFNQKRTPSWCDRILYLPYESPAQVINYASLPSVVTSDHKPVYLRINVPSSPPQRVFEPEPGAPKRLLLLPEYAPAVTRAAPQAAAPVRLSLGLGDHAGYYNGVGWTADMVIGWSLYFFNTPRGRIYAGLFLAALFALYLIL